MYRTVATDNVFSIYYPRVEFWEKVNTMVPSAVVIIIYYTRVVNNNGVSFLHASPFLSACNPATTNQTRQTKSRGLNQVASLLWLWFKQAAATTAMQHCLCWHNVLHGARNPIRRRHVQREIRLWSLFKPFPEDCGFFLPFPLVSGNRMVCGGWLLPGLREICR